MNNRFLRVVAFATIGAFAVFGVGLVVSGLGMWMDFVEHTVGHNAVGLGLVLAPVGLLFGGLGALNTQ